MKIFPVVHIDINNDLEVAKRDSNRAFELDADGIYLINHRNSGYGKKAIFETFNSIMAESADRYVGLNILDLSPIDAMSALDWALRRSDKLISPPSGLLINNMRDDLPVKSAMEFKNSHPNLGQVRLVGGIAIRNTETYTGGQGMALYETEWLKGSVDVVLTNGDDIEQPPAIEKLRTMKEVIGRKALAVIGGISSENIDQYEGVVDEVLVNPRIETGSNYGVFNSYELKKLIKKAHDLAKSNTNEKTLDLASLRL